MSALHDSAHQLARLLLASLVETHRNEHLNSCPANKLNQSEKPDEPREELAPRRFGQGGASPRSMIDNDPVHDVPNTTTPPSGASRWRAREVPLEQSAD